MFGSTGSLTHKIKDNMTTTTLIIIGAVGLVLGMYISSQVMGHITSRTSNKKLMDNINEFDKRENND
jgi:hypothetical protein